jgi:hypothetical protein
MAAFSAEAEVPDSPEYTAEPDGGGLRWFRHGVDAIPARV